MAEYQLLGGPPRFGLWSGYAYTINSVIGGGFLAIPWAYQNGGWLFMMSIQILCLFVGWLLTSQLLEVTSRVTAMAQSKSTFAPVSFTSAVKLGLHCESPATHAAQNPSTRDPELVDELQFDLYDIVKRLMGDKWALVYMFCSTAFLLSTLTVYVNIFGTGFATNVHIFSTCDYSKEPVSELCEWQYVFSISLFFLMMAYFSSIEFHEQLFMQITMTILRLFVLFAIITIALLSAIYEKNIDNADTYISGSPPLADISTLGRTAPILLFAAIYQPYYPGILNSIQKDPEILKKIVMYVTISLLALYCTLGLVTSLSIHNLPTNVSLLFYNFTFGYAPEERPWWTYLIGYPIVMFPAIDMVSIFPLVAHAVSDNVMSMLYSAEHTARRASALKYYGLRVGCIIPAFVYAFYSLKLGPIVNNSGLFAFFLTFFMIPLLHISGKAVVAKLSPYDVRCNPLWLSLFITCCSVPLFFWNAATAFGE